MQIVRCVKWKIDRYYKLARYEAELKKAKLMEEKGNGKSRYVERCKPLLELSTACRW